MNKSQSIEQFFYPEIAVSGYSSVDGTVEFYGRVGSLVDKTKCVLDFGAGRGVWYEDDHCDYRKEIRHIRPKALKVIGCDIDDAISENRTIDEYYLISIGERLPFEDASFDIIVADWAFEHIANPREVANEFYRILKPGGWICGRTPNKYSYISVITRLVKNSHHKKVLSYAQPNRKDIDVFPTTFKLNSKRDISNYFTKNSFDNFTYRYEAEPAYHFGSRFIFALMLLVNKIIPSIFKSTLHIFLKKCALENQSH
jgi:SAM-dependent methyltransferase